jgi:hypothetical protein
MNDVAPTLPTSCGSLPPEGAAAPAVWQSQSRGPGLGGKAAVTSVRLSPHPDNRISGSFFGYP